MKYEIEKTLIIGGGAAGIAIGKTFQQRGMDFVIVEREDDFAGNWYFGSQASRVYRSTHLISSKTNTQFSDFPMPNDFPEYPSHTQFLQYLRMAAKEYGLYDHALLNVSVNKLVPEDNGWLAELSNGESHWYPEVVVANGLLREPFVPEIKGHFNGKLLHSSEYSDPDIFKGKTVLIVGGGNSGCDIAVDSAHCATKTYHSLRRGYHFMPKFIDGKPTQEWLMEIVYRFNTPEDYWSHVKQTFKLAGFDGTDYGLPEPDHDIHQAHPIMNSNVLYHIGHGDIIPVDDIDTFDGDEVQFLNGARIRPDMVVLATGYKPSMPFLDSGLIDWTQGLHHLFLNCLPLNWDNILFAGYFNIPSGFGNLANNCSRFIANYFTSRRQNSRAWKVINEIKHQRDQVDLGQSQFVQNRRHAHELDLWKYIKTVNFLNEKMEADMSVKLSLEPNAMGVA